MGRIECKANLWSATEACRHDKWQEDLGAHLNMDTPPLFISSDLNDVGGKARAVHRNALAIDLCVTTT